MGLPITNTTIPSYDCCFGWIYDELEFTSYERTMQTVLSACGEEGRKNIARYRLVVITARFCLKPSIRAFPTHNQNKIMVFPRK